jgi:flavin reductase (DIM6/NTAB) family NADH-FMN oxidoreductase RutF
MSDPELFRQAFRRHATTVAVLTYRDERGEPVGMTATSMCSLSADPPSLLACVNRETRAHPEILRIGAFGVELLAVSQRAIAYHCGAAGRDKHLRPGWLAPDAPPDGSPRLAASLAHLECHVDRSYDVYSHTIIVGRIESVWLNPVDAPPLLYHGGVYGQLESAAERAERFHWELTGE